MFQMPEVDVQERVVADATAVRERHKHIRVTQELRSSRVHCHKLIADYGCATILDSIQFVNPSGEAQTFRVEVRRQGASTGGTLSNTFVVPTWSVSRNSVCAERLSRCSEAHQLTGRAGVTVW